MTWIGWGRWWRDRHRPCSGCDGVSGLPPEAARRFRDSGLLDTPVHVGLCAVREAARDGGMLHVQIAPTATGPQQKEIIAGLLAELGEEPWFWSVPWSTLGFHLGTVYLSAPPELLTPIPVDGRVQEHLPAREEALKPYFGRVLWGGPGLAVERLIRSTRRRAHNDLNGRV